MDQYKNQFPANFFWGASTASHQVEGGNHNQWTVWELEHAKELAQTAEERLSWLPVWKEIKEQATDPSNYVSGDGVEHYKRFKDDFELIKKLNLNSYRFGIEWSRIEPEQGKWNEKEIDYYRNYIRELKRRDIEPFLNLWHWTLPTWFTDSGGFANRANLKHWDRFAQKVADVFGKEINFLITLNEPNVYTSFGYVTGQWPPNERNLFKSVLVIWNLVQAHKRAYKIFKSVNPNIHIGIAGQLANIQAKRPHNMSDALVTKWMRYVWNWWFYNRIRKQQDFIGFNYYFTDYYKGYLRDNPHVPVNDLGWYMEPEGLYPILLRAWAHYRKPIIVTENGVADKDDQYRRWWIEETIIAMQRALSEGVELRGYFHWSLLDNFEWAYGWWPKFGLVSVDRDHGMKRELRPSAHWFADTVKRYQQNK